VRQPLNITNRRGRLLEKFAVNFVAIICPFFFTFSALGCPATLFNTELSPIFSGPRVNVKLFAWTDEPGRSPGWEVIPFQVDPVDDNGFLMFFKDRSFINQPIQKNDVMIFNVDRFGKKADLRKTPLPCKSNNSFQLYDLAGKKYAYIAMCDETQQESQFVSQVRYNEKDDFLESDSYRYKFNDSNYMLFKEVSYLSDEKKLVPIAWDSDMMIRADVKRFFTMHFDSKDIVSKLEESRLGPVANLARVSFFLKILIFKIRMSLNTDVGFFRDSGHIPMMINIPVESSKYLNPKSGILYSWQPSAQSVYQSAPGELPGIDVKKVGEGFKKLGEYGLTFCRGAECKFKYQIDVDGRILSMDLGIKKDLVARGFFPMYVHDIATFSKEMGWGETYDKAKGRSGLYFEVSGLPKGGHPWDFWMRLGARTNKNAQCPAMVFISRPTK
jgi:hypothetical protein